jgi:hypothetical protein
VEVDSRSRLPEKELDYQTNPIRLTPPDGKRKAFEATAKKRTMKK